MYDTKGFSCWCFGLCLLHLDKQLWTRSASKVTYSYHNKNSDNLLSFCESVQKNSFLGVLLIPPLHVVIYIHTNIHTLFDKAGCKMAANSDVDLLYNSERYKM